MLTVNNKKYDGMIGSVSGRMLFIMYVLPIQCVILYVSILTKKIKTT